MRKLVLTAAAVLAALALAWTAALEHQANCVDAGKTGCSVLPWKDGHAKPQGGPLSQQEIDRLLGRP
jgi:Spy/CpxP family protein refolding chaperone